MEYDVQIIRESLPQCWIAHISDQILDMRPGRIAPSWCRAPHQAHDVAIDVAKLSDKGRRNETTTTSD